MQTLRRTMSGGVWQSAARADKSARSSCDNCATDHCRTSTATPRTQFTVTQVPCPNAATWAHQCTTARRSVRRPQNARNTSGAELGAVHGSRAPDGRLPLDNLRPLRIQSALSACMRPQNIRRRPDGGGAGDLRVSSRSKRLFVLGSEAPP
eukprot:COSAG02_NODE_1457_length_12507_cov_7.416989_2_plen_151_part_00